MYTGGMVASMSQTQTTEINEAEIECENCGEGNKRMSEGVILHGTDSGKWWLECAKCHRKL